MKYTYANRININGIHIQNKDKAFNSKADDKLSKNREPIKRPFSESDTDEGDSPQKKEN